MYGGLSSLLVDSVGARHDDDDDDVIISHAHCPPSVGRS